MGMTIAEKILAAHADRGRVSPKEIVDAKVDYVMVNDVTGLPAFEVFEEFDANPIREKTVLIQDHYVPNKDVASAEQAKSMRDFARRYGIENHFDVGRGGVCHQIMIEEGFAAPGRLIVGADSHTCSYGALGALSTGIGSSEAASAMATGELWFRVPETQKFVVDGELGKYVMGKDIILHIIGDIGVSGSLYKSMEFYGSAIESLHLSDRITISNKNRVIGEYSPVYADEDAEYEDTTEYDASEIVPLVATPHLPENVTPASEIDVQIDQAYLGSCTNGRIEDLRAAAAVLKGTGKSVHPDVRMIVVPASKSVFEQAMREGLIGIFMDADAYVAGPTCGACLGGYMGVLAGGERCVSSTNRNFIGRMGHPDSEVYLANPAVVAASAITGRITDPGDLLEG